MSRPDLLERVIACLRQHPGASFDFLHEAVGGEPTHLRRLLARQVRAGVLGTVALRKREHGRGRRPRGYKFVRRPTPAPRRGRAREAPPWVEEWRSRFGTMPDKDIAAQVGVCRQTVTLMRSRLGIARFRP